MVTVPEGDYLWFVDQALDRMVVLLDRLGDRAANRRPDLPGANSPYALVTHCLGVMEYWGGLMVAGRTVERDRDAEFRAEGSVADLIAGVARARRQLAADVATAESAAAPRRPPVPADADLPFGRTQGGVLLHIFEELAQHLGHLEVTCDVLTAGTIGQ